MTTADVTVPAGIVASCVMVLCTLLPAVNHSAIAAPRGDAVMPFEVMTADDITRAGMRGTGCAWMTARGRSIRFVASDDRAVVKLRGAFHRLKPAREAVDMFPFTYDRWKKDAMTVQIVASNRSKRMDGEASSATLKVTIGNRSSKYPGHMNCGT